MKKCYYLLLVLTLIACHAVAQKKVNYKIKGAPVPPFLLAKTAGGNFANTQLLKGKPVWIMIFSPQCDHCEHMIDSLKQLTDRFKTTQLVLVAEDRNKEFMPDFIKKTGMAAHPLFRNTGTDKSNLIYYIYTEKILPQINIYNSSHKLVKTFDGNYLVDSLKSYIK